MKAYTRFLRNTYESDHMSIMRHNNSAESRRTEEQNKKAWNDKCDYYTRKWNELLEGAETPAQKEICNTMLGLIERQRKYFD